MMVLESNNITANLKGRNVRVGSRDDVRRYFKVIGSSNPKHLKRMGK